MQYRAKAFEPDLFKARLDAMNQAEIDATVADYVREEALYREALKMGMEEGDYIIRQRLVQKVEFLLENLTSQNIEPSDDELLSYYQKHQADYRIDEVYTFTHIFFDAQNGGMDEAKRRAMDVLKAHPDIPFENSSQYGDRYPFLQNYVDRTRDYVVNNFNEEFVQELDKVDPDPAHWYGPFASKYGEHLVLLRSRTPARTPGLDEIRPRVLDDWRYETQALRRKEAEDKVVGGYEVVEKLDKPAQGEGQ